MFPVNGILVPSLHSSEAYLSSSVCGICAAGTGAFLDSVALKLNVPVEEMEKLADYSTELEFSSVCAVLSATSINKFKNRYPIGQIIGAACRAQARTIISGVGELLTGRILSFDALTANFYTFQLPRDPACPVCGKHPTITQLCDYEP